MSVVLVTGGAGYIGSHTVVELLDAGHDVVIVDNFANSSPIVVGRIAELSGRAPDLYRLDLADRAGLDEVFAAHEIDAVVHFAGLKAVGESVARPLRYYRVNLGSTLTLLEAMSAAGVHAVVFSSSATVYGNDSAMPLDESAPLGATNPYGWTKLMQERIFTDMVRSDSQWRVALLRYFNPIGAHPSGRLGEDPLGIPDNLVPFAMQVAVGRREQLDIFGGDYPTRDGTGVRDYIHVVDLARGHLRALEFVDEHPGAHVWNLGTGLGSTVLEVVAAVERATGRPLPYRIVDRRPGDVAESYASVDKAASELGWRAERDLDAMCRDHWAWQRQNPDGYVVDE